MFDMAKRGKSLIDLLKLLRDKYPNTVEEKEICEYNDVLLEPLGLLPSSPGKGQGSNITYLAKRAVIRQTNYIELIKGTVNPTNQTTTPNRYRINLKGMELLSQIEMQESSKRLERLTLLLAVITSILAIFALTSIMLTPNITVSDIQQTLSYAAVIVIIAIIVLVIAFHIMEVYF